MGPIPSIAMHGTRFSLAAIVAVLGSIPASAQSAVIRQGDPSPLDPQWRILHLQGMRLNGNGGFACAFESQDGDGYWGTYDGTAPGLLREPGTYAGLTQRELSGTFGLAPSEAIYTTHYLGAPGGTAIDRSLWIGDQLVFQNGDPVPGSTTLFWSSFARAGSTRTGMPTFVAAYADAQGSPKGGGIFRGANATPLVESGTQLANVPEQVEWTTGRPGISSLGTRVFTQVRTTGMSATSLVIGDAAVFAGGARVAIGETIPSSIGGLGDDWELFNGLQINEGGQTVFTARTSHPSRRGVIVRNRQIWLRTGDVVDGRILKGDPSPLVALNDAGEVAYTWFTAPLHAPGRFESTLFVGDRAILIEGDEVDWDGDGVLDPNARFDFISHSWGEISLDRDGTVYALAWCTVPGWWGNDIGILRFDPPAPGSTYGFCAATANSTGEVGDLAASGSTDVAANDLDVLASDLPASAATIFLVSRTESFVRLPAGSMGNVCLGGDIGRFYGQVQLSTGAGTATLDVDLTALPQPTGTVAALPGQTWRFQAWHRDLDPAGQVPTSNVTRGLAVVLR